MTTLADYILCIDQDDQVFPETLCEALMKLYEVQPQRNRIDLGYRNCEVITILSNTFVNRGTRREDDQLVLSMVDVFDELKKASHCALQAYMQRVAHGNSYFQLKAMELPNLLSYDPEQENDSFHPHIDAWEQGTSSRGLSIIFYLNDVEEGGETVFHTAQGPGGEPFKIKPKRRRVVIFPSSFPYVHEGTKPISGKKHIVVSWLHFGRENHAFPTVPLY